MFEMFEMEVMFEIVGRSLIVDEVRTPVEVPDRRLSYINFS